MKQKIIYAICAIVLLVGIVITSIDGIMLIFKCARFWQYVFNMAFMCVIVPVCIGICDLPKKMKNL